MAKRGMGGHQSPKNKTDVWLTPPEIVQALGKFDLDPCALSSRPWDSATSHYHENGLARNWFQRVWLNPPYGAPSIITPWMKKMADHNHGTAIIFARTETDMFHEYVWNRASALLFLRGRLHFHHADGTRARHNAGAPSVLVAYGRDDAAKLFNCQLEGHIVSNLNGGAWKSPQ